MDYLHCSSWQPPCTFALGLNQVCHRMHCIQFLSFLAINCGDPGTPTNGQRSLSSTTYNSVVTYTCDVGYSLQGLSSRKCLYTGQWTGNVTLCIGKSVKSLLHVLEVRNLLPPALQETSERNRSQTSQSAYISYSQVLMQYVLLPCRCRSNFHILLFAFYSWITCCT